MRIGSLFILDEIASEAKKTSIYCYELRAQGKNE